MREKQKILKEIDESLPKPVPFSESTFQFLTEEKLVEKEIPFPEFKHLANVIVIHNVSEVHSLANEAEHSMISAAHILNVSMDKISQFIKETVQEIRERSIPKPIF